MEAFQNGLKAGHFNDSFVQKSVLPLVEAVTCRAQIWCGFLHLHNIVTPPASKANVMGYEPGMWCKFPRVKGHRTKNCYQFKKEIERLIQEGYLKKYMKGDSSHELNKYNSRGRDDVGSPKPNKVIEASQGEDSKVVRHTLYTKAAGFTETWRLAPTIESMLAKS